MRKQLYLDIKEHLMTVLTADNKPLFAHFDLWNRQVDFLEQETPFATPALFVEFDTMQWRTIGQRTQECNPIIRLHIVTEWFSGTDHLSPIESRALDFLDLSDLVVARMQAFRTDYMNSWMRTASITNHDHERYVDSVEEYTCLLCDTSAVPHNKVVDGISLYINQ